MASVMREGHRTWEERASRALRYCTAAGRFWSPSLLLLLELELELVQASRHLRHPVCCFHSSTNSTCSPEPFRCSSAVPFGCGESKFAASLRWLRTGLPFGHRLCSVQVPYPNTHTPKTLLLPPTSPSLTCNLDPYRSLIASDNPKTK